MTPPLPGSDDQRSPAVTQSATGVFTVDRAVLRKRLTPLQYQVTQEKGTERAFTGRYNKHREPGVYQCLVCGSEIFSSVTKYDSGSGWPSFYDVIDASCVTLKTDLSHGMERTEVSCSRCSAHLGHVFKDGPKPTGKRYCVNSEALEFSLNDAMDVPDGKVEFFKGSCGLVGSCAPRGTVRSPPPRTPTGVTAISRVVDKYNQLGGASEPGRPADPAAVTLGAKSGVSETPIRDKIQGGGQVLNGRA